MVSFCCRMMKVKTVIETQLLMVSWNIRIDWTPCVHFQECIKKLSIYFFERLKPHIIIINLVYFVYFWRNWIKTIYWNFLICFGILRMVEINRYGFLLNMLCTNQIAIWACEIVTSDIKLVVLCCVNCIYSSLQSLNFESHVYKHFFCKVKEKQ